MTNVEQTSTRNIDERDTSEQCAKLSGELAVWYNVDRVAKLGARRKLASGGTAVVSWWRDICSRAQPSPERS